jgi:1,4-alpha-glucan branching enzyme
MQKQAGSPGKVRVTFSLPVGMQAETVHLVGDFNDWNPHATPLRLQHDTWSVSLELDAGKSYHYRFLLNGSRWINDWDADDYQPNEHGGDDSVVVALLAQEAGTFEMPSLPPWFTSRQSALPTRRVA